MPKQVKKEDIKKPKTKAEYEKICVHYMQNNTIHGTAKQFGISSEKVKMAISYCRDAGFFSIPENDELLQNILLDKIERRQHFRNEYIKAHGKEKREINDTLDKLETSILTLKGLIADKKKIDLHIKDIAVIGKIVSSLEKIVHALSEDEYQKLIKFLDVGSDKDRLTHTQIDINEAYFFCEWLRKYSSTNTQNDTITILHSIHPFYEYPPTCAAIDLDQFLHNRDKNTTGIMNYLKRLTKAKDRIEWVITILGMMSYMIRTLSSEEIKLLGKSLGNTFHTPQKMSFYPLASQQISIDVNNPSK